jgi:hypothetical protein
MSRALVFAVLALCACAEGVPTLGTAISSSGAGGGGAAGTAGAPAFAGESCANSSATGSCSCAGGASGTKSCLANPASPTGFAYGSCGMCLRPDSGGMGGISGTGGASGTGVVGDGGVGDCDPSACPMPTAVIPFVPPPAACCTESGTCGAVDLFGGCG